MRNKSLLFVITISLLLQACGVIRTGSRPGDYTPERRPATTDIATVRILQTGVASWYGPGFNGRQTANGERYDMNDMTAAHRTLPFNTLVRVINESNDLSVDVRINDRGPYVDDRIIDLSLAAATKLEMTGPGTANVIIYLLQDGDRPVTQNRVTNNESWTIQLASFDSRNPAELEAGRIEGARVEMSTFSGQTAYRVYYGTYPAIHTAEEALALLRSRGLNGFVKQVEN